jgi:limonene 1,2-monooxygenase
LEVPRHNPEPLHAQQIDGNEILAALAEGSIEASFLPARAVDRWTETRDKARENVRFGMQAYVDYINNNMPRFNVPPGEDIVDYWMRAKIGVIGTPDDAIAQIRKLQAKQGEFGVMLHMANNIADWEATKRSYELYARYVMPVFDGSNAARDESYDWVTRNRDTLSRQRKEAAQRMIDKHAAERAAKTGRKEVTDRRSDSLFS